MEMDHFNAMLPSEWSYCLGGWPRGSQLNRGVQGKQDRNDHDAAETALCMFAFCLEK